MIKATVCEIEKYAIHDGPGIRTTVFLKGCPLKCLWCSNPETQKRENEVYYNMNKCILCGRCVQECSNNALKIEKDRVVVDRQKCEVCGECIEVCPMGALNLVGKTMSITDVIEEVNKDRIFYEKSGGGVTVSGGEVLINGEFVVELLKKCKEEYINTAIETSGFGKWDTLFNISRYADLIMFDIKHTNCENHKKLTGVSNETILNNLSKLSKLHSNIIIRVPLIPGLNDSVKNIQNTSKIAKENGIKEIHLLPYHSLGKEKYRQLQKEYKLEQIKTPSKDNLASLKKVVEGFGIKCVIGG
ncbi:glycyl-radical enzyme activating protein [Haloimpatiens sp. FM7330]|uniref:glycyl-radical enzyme activating protein n=1 Tax=Haloimpatiens sp. FM7330 TaxID=3298610 RepID=UPI00362AC782